MNEPTMYPQEVRERAVRMVFEHRDEHPSQWATICSIAEKFGMSPETLRSWVRRAEIDGGIRPGSPPRICAVGQGRPVARVSARTTSR